MSQMSVSVGMTKKKKLLIVFGCILGAVAVAYASGCFYYRNHFMPNTSVNNTNVSNDNLLEAEAAITVPSKDFVINEKNGSETINLGTINYRVSVEDSTVLNTMRSQNAFTWPVHLFKSSSYETALNTSYDADKLKQEISQLNAFTSSDITQPTDAYIDKQNGVYVIVPEQEGTALDQDKVVSAIESKLDNNENSVDLASEGCYLKAGVTSDDEGLNGRLRALTAVNNETITIDLGGGSTEELSGEQLADMITVDENGKVSVVPDKLNAYVDTLADEYDTMGTTRSFTTSNGQVISVGTSNDTYGYLMNKDSTYSALESAITSGQTQTVSAFFDVSAATRNASNGDIGNSYIEVSLAAQHLWLYENGSLVLDSDVITGNPTYNQSTPTGVFRVWAKQRNATLKGKNNDGTKYESPVSFWMPIDWTGVGLHDATWQPAFGGDLLYTRGSHGCVNLPYNVAEQIFNTIDVNIPVVIY